MQRKILISLGKLHLLNAHIKLQIVIEVNHEAFSELHFFPVWIHVN